MNPQTRTSAKDFFLNLGAIVALYTVVITLINLLFTIINKAYPQITNGYNYFGSQSISWPVAMLIIFFPIFVLLMWILEKGYESEPEKRNLSVRRWLTYITLFVAGLAIAIDLVTILYYFIDGQELTIGFILKVLALLAVALGVFIYYISDLRGSLTSSSRKIWAGVAALVVLGSIVWGFSVLGSPRTQRLYKYDDAKINDLMNVNSAVQNYYSTKGVLPKDFTELSTLNYYINIVDAQNQKSYEYSVKGALSYEVCAEFNKDSQKKDNFTTNYPYGGTPWTHPEGRYCFEQTINPNTYNKPLPLR